VACMHDGFKVVDMDFGAGHARTAVRFDAHESLAYGCDWSFGDEEGEHGSTRTPVISCSFYDHELHLWKV
jgi:diphthine methyl ester acylhydrolase